MYQIRHKTNYDLRITIYELFIIHLIIFRRKLYKNTTFLSGMSTEEKRIKLLCKHKNIFTEFLQNAATDNNFKKRY